MPKGKEEEKGFFEIYSTIHDAQPKLIQVSEPLHMKILEGLAKHPMSTTEISDYTKKAQSTLSMHIEELINQKLIISENDPTDTRRKIYKLKARKIAFTKDSTPNCMKSVSNYVEYAINNTEYFSLSVVNGMLITLESSGLDISPMMGMIGEYIGAKLSAKFSINKLEDAVKELQKFFKENYIGLISVFSFQPLTIIVNTDTRYPLKLESINRFYQGVFKTYLNHSLNKKYDVIESEIYGAENNFFKFVMEISTDH